MNQSLAQKYPLANQMTSYLAATAFGCSLIIISSWIKIPIYPIPFTLQTFAICLLALTQSPKVAFSSAICYLICGTIGLPVISTQLSDFWWMGRSAGYLIAFPIAAYLISRLAQTWHPLLSVLCGELVIYTLGFLGLAYFVDAKTAFVSGVLIFMPSCVFKCLLAVGIASLWKKVRP